MRDEPLSRLRRGYAPAGTVRPEHVVRKIPQAGGSRASRAGSGPGSGRGAAGHPVEAPRFAHGPVLWDLAGLGYSARGFRRDAGPRNRERKA